MYTIREDSANKLLVVQIWGRVTTDEALRAISQAFTLAEASHIQAISCDISGLTKGPARLLVLAASVTLRYQPGMRIALTGTTRQLGIATRLAKFSGLREGMQAFDLRLDADNWLRPALVQAGTKLSSTARRHAETLLGVGGNGVQDNQHVLAQGAKPAA
jgi:hypothetical protein